MALTARQLNRATLDRQLLLARRRIGVVEAVRTAVALQAQEPASPYVALWNRLEGFDPAHLDRAFSERTVFKASLMRITLHAVVAGDHPSFHEAMTPTLRAARLDDKRFRSTGLTTEEADELVPDLVDFASTPRSKDEIVGHLADRLGHEPDERLWWALRTYAPLVHSPTESPWSFGRRPVYEAAPGADARPSGAGALRELVVRYLDGFGPATVADFCQFTLRKRSDARVAFDGLRGRVAGVEGPDGEELFDVHDGPPIPDPDAPAPPRLMAMWDSVLLAYADRSRVIPDEYRAHVIRRNGDTLPTVFADGRVAGVWRPTDEGIEVTAFHRLDDDTWAAIAVEAAALSRLLAGRDPDVYRRYGRWWDQLPVAERHVLPR